jgi:hypothetical protein
MRRATENTYPQKISQMAMYAAARKFRFFNAALPKSNLPKTVCSRPYRVRGG